MVLLRISITLLFTRKQGRAQIGHGLVQSVKGPRFSGSENRGSGVERQETQNMRKRLSVPTPLCQLFQIHSSIFDTRIHSKQDNCLVLIAPTARWILRKRTDAQMGGVHKTATSHSRLLCCGCSCILFCCVITWNRTELQIRIFGDVYMALPIKKKALIETERLTIKPYALEDVDGLVDLLTNPEITKTFMVPEFESLEQMEDLAKKLIVFSQEEDSKHLEYGIYFDGKIIGFVNDCGIGDEEIEIGYLIHPDYQGHGYATEAVRAIICELREMGFRKVTAGYFAENTASRRVMEKCGMQQTAVTDEVEYRGEHYICRYCEIIL